MAAWYLIPLKIQQILKRQGIDGPPPPSLFSGNLSEMKRMKMVHDESSTFRDGNFRDYTKDIFPYFDQWRKAYGETFLYWMQRRPALYVTDPSLIREISLCVSLDIGKPTYLQKGQEPLFGQGIIKSNGLLWANQRKLISPEFYMVKVKGLVEIMVQAAQPILSAWEGIIEQGEGNTVVITVDEYFRSYSADIICRKCFGSDYERGKQIYRKLKELSVKMIKSSIIFELSYLRFFPTRQKRELKALVQEINSQILQLVKKRKDETNNASANRDFLQSLIENKMDFSDELIVDNIKNIYFAGFDTAAVTATWCMMLLATHPDWQSRTRAEVMNVCDGRPLDFDLLSKMKTLTMVIQETLRLFPPASFVARETFRDIKIGTLHVPRNVNMWIPISTMHHDKSIWGPDADKFNPDRFANGISSACKKPYVFMPFGLGARTCLGQNLALVELKVILARILPKFTFALAPEYQHLPAFRMVVEPEFGLPLIMKKLA
ncbi:cytochrome P450 714D1-like protein [Carex littledalei]|uniref:Cytochrome P450 714D1-like protein n=1 Tax=Carex littledalei TaxID=544730 RepID=A0A833QCV1_9POAL|nr:cytochrome P450 714D1-like protein [Carex littledalei]